VIAGKLLALAMSLPETPFMGTTLHGWKYVLMMLALPGVLACALLLMVPEPPRRGVIEGGKPLPIRAVMSEIWRRRAVYGPLFLGLGFSAAHAMAAPAWMVPFYKRTYGWTEMEIASRAPMFMLAGQIAGLLLGPMLIKLLARRYRDANVRAVTICFSLAAPLAIIGPMMPSPWLALTCSMLSGMLGIASAVPQNLVIQEITPNQMRGQVTGLYLMMFTAVGAVGPFMIGFSPTMCLAMTPMCGNLWCFPGVAQPCGGLHHQPCDPALCRRAGSARQGNAMTYPELSMVIGGEKVGIAHRRTMMC
jgi:hypothetical protein